MLSWIAICFSRVFPNREKFDVAFQVLWSKPSFCQFYLLGWLSGKLTLREYFSNLPTRNFWNWKSNLNVKNTLVIITKIIIKNSICFLWKQSFLQKHISLHRPSSSTSVLLCLSLSLIFHFPPSIFPLASVRTSLTSSLAWVTHLPFFCVRILIKKPMKVVINWAKEVMKDMLNKSRHQRVNFYDEREEERERINRCLIEGKREKCGERKI